MSQEDAAAAIEVAKQQLGSLGNDYLTPISRTPSRDSLGIKNTRVVKTGVVSVKRSKSKRKSASPQYDTIAEENSDIPELVNQPQQKGTRPVIQENMTINSGVIRIPDNK